MSLIEEKIFELFEHYMQYISAPDSREVATPDNLLRKVGLPFLLWAVGCFILAVLAGWMTTYIAPTAAGSGVPEIVGNFNGIYVDKFLCVKSYLVKVIGVTFAVSSKLCIGKEGPLAHIGANVGNMVPYIKFLGLEFMQNDFKKREMIAAGTAAGVSVAFGAPIGGALFGYELSKGTQFWTFRLLWKVFFACSVATFTLAIL